jgi:hypothetical protein
MNFLVYLYNSSIVMKGFLFSSTQLCFTFVGEKDLVNLASSQWLLSGVTSVGAKATPQRYNLVLC